MLTILLSSANNMYQRVIFVHWSRDAVPSKVQLNFKLECDVALYTPLVHLFT